MFMTGVLCTVCDTRVYTETKKFSNTLQILIFITEIHGEISTEFVQ